MCIKYRINLIPVEHITLLGYFCDDSSNFKKYMMPYFNNNTITNLLLLGAPGDVHMQPEYFGSETPSTTFTNSPYTDGPFYGYRLVYTNFYNSTSPHLYTVELHEMYPIWGRVWSITYDINANNWLGWKHTAMDSDISTLQSNFQAGCSTIASSITSNGVSTASNASPSTMANNISTLATNKYNSGYSAGQSASTLKRVDLGTSNSISCTGYSGWQNFTTNNFAFYISSYGSVYANASGTNTHAGSVSYSYNSSTGVFTKSITDGYSNDTIDGNNSTHKSYLTLGVILYYV
jgi:hypothetical protein